MTSFGKTTSLSVLILYLFWVTRFANLHSSDPSGKIASTLPKLRPTVKKAAIHCPSLTYHQTAVVSTSTKCTLVRKTLKQPQFQQFRFRLFETISEFIYYKHGWNWRKWRGNSLDGKGKKGLFFLPLTSVMFPFHLILWPQLATGKRQKRPTLTIY